MRFAYRRMKELFISFTVQKQLGDFYFCLKKKKIAYAGAIRLKIAGVDSSRIAHEFITITGEDK